MRGLPILARTMSVARQIKPKDKYAWQYHPRSDHHSKISCWAVMFDIMLNSELIREHVAEGKIAFGINHILVDHTNGRRKALDLVICRPAIQQQSPIDPDNSFASLAAKNGLVLDAEDRRLLSQLPPLQKRDVGTVLMALEAKAAMTAFAKARPRLYDELASSHLVVHGDTDSAIAVGLVLINAAERFLSPTRNHNPADGVLRVESIHEQPRDLELTIEKVRSLPRRDAVGKPGFDAIAAVAIDCRNDGQAPVEIVTDPNRGAVGPQDVLHYSTMINRVVGIYNNRFPRA